MKPVQYFKALKTTNRFNANQKVWIRMNYANHLAIWYKWRENGRYVSGIINKFDTAVGDIVTIDVDDAFADRIVGNEVVEVA